MNKKTSHQITAIMLALFACLIWSGNFVMARGVHEFIPPFGLAFWRWATAFALVLIISWKQVLNNFPIIKKHWKYFASIGVLGVGTFNTIVYIAAADTTANNIALLCATSPIWTLVLAAALGQERFSRYKIGGMILASLGAVLIITSGEISKLLEMEFKNADLMLLLAAWIWAFWSIMLKYKPQGVGDRSLMATVVFFGLLALAPFYAYEAIYIKPSPFTFKAWTIYLYMGWAASVIAWFSWVYAINHIGAVRTSLIYYSMPVFSGLMAIIFLGEKIEWFHFAGFALVCGGIIFSNLRKLGLVKK